MLVFVDLNNYAEVGAFIDPTGLGTQCQTFTTPHLLVYAHQGTTEKCKQNPPSLNAGSYYTVDVQNTAHNNTVDYYLGTTYEGSYTVSFNQGDVESFDERHYTSDSLYAKMDGLGYMGSAGGWNDWPNLTHGVSSPVSGWNFCKISNINYKVISSSC